MHASAASTFYRRYIDCLNSRNLGALSQFVNSQLTYNKQEMQLQDYIDLLNGNFKDIPDLFFEIGLLVCDDNKIASRLIFNCTPVGEFLGIPVNNRRVVFSEHVLYELSDGKISKVWSLIDKDAIRDQLM